MSFLLYTASKWDYATDKAFEVLKENDTEIGSTVSEIVEELDGTYCVEVSFNRWIQEDNNQMKSVLSFENDYSLPNIENKLGYFEAAQYYVCVEIKSMQVTERVNYSIMKSWCNDNYELVGFVDNDEYSISTYKNKSY